MRSSSMKIRDIINDRFKGNIQTASLTLRENTASIGGKSGGGGGGGGSLAPLGLFRVENFPRESGFQALGLR
jgi:hypothetical protein